MIKSKQQKPGNLKGKTMKQFKIKKIKKIKKESLLFLFCLSLGTLSSSNLKAQVGLVTEINDNGNFDGNRFKPTLDHNGFINAEGGYVGEKGDYDFFLNVNKSFNPFEIQNNGNPLVSRILHRNEGHLGFSYGILKGLKLGLDLPYIFYQRGAHRATRAFGTGTPPGFGFNTIGTGVGDLGISAKIGLRQEGPKGLNLALISRVTVPTSGKNNDYLGEDGVSVLHEFAVSKALPKKPMDLIGNVGILLRPDIDIPIVNTEISDEITYRAGFRYHFMDRVLNWGLQLEGNLPINTSGPNKEETGAEALTQIAYRMNDKLEVSMGGGYGIQHGFSIPDWRFFGGIRIWNQNKFVPRPGAGVVEILDTDKDGIEDARDKCPKVASDGELSGCPKVYQKGNRLAFQEDILFFSGKDEIKPDSYEVLGDIVAFLGENSGVTTLYIHGHTDSEGEEEFNQELSEKRALAVKNYLASKGFAGDVAITKGFGEREPIASNETEEGRLKNRRVEFFVVDENNPDVWKEIYEKERLAEEAMKSKKEEPKEEIAIVPPPTVDTDGDGILDHLDAAPNEKEDMDGFEDEDGKPEYDNDQDGVTDDKDHCPNWAGDPNNVSKPGCPQALKVRVDGCNIEMSKAITFISGSAKIKRSSNKILNLVGRYLRENPDVTLVHIYGHTDSDGDENKNKTLSKKRVRSVKDYLIKKGVESSRMNLRGFGEEEPIADNSSPWGKAKNRRVEIKVDGCDG